jgi:hypothetical protein
MAQALAAAGVKERPAVLGVRVSADLRTKIKMEAARRGITIALLFEEMWETYLERRHVSGR